MLELSQHIDKVKKACKQHHVDKMYLIGSAVDHSFNDASDVDFLVTFEPFERAQYFKNFISLKSSLETVLNRRIDLLETQNLRNPILIKSIERSKKLIYG
ncbi:MAG: nucleotidyltransferase domain-containing protein [Marinoscillum sp.]|uniref:nucleotidyltransferase family protein n=1 Tax=Marinoscillum sp. TaxID=2024838 RepID=UPI0032FCF019